MSPERLLELFEISSHVRGGPSDPAKRLQTRRRRTPIGMSGNLSCFLDWSSYRFYTVDGCYGCADDDCEGEKEPASEEEDIVAEVKGCGPRRSTASQTI